MPIANRNPLVHGSNLEQKENHRTKYRDSDSRRYLREIRVEYDKWHEANLQLIGPTSTPTNRDEEIITRRVEFLSEYKDFLDQQHYAEKFDSRSNLHSSVLEEFLYYLFRDLAGDFGENALIGKSHSFKDIFFVPPNYSQMLKRPYARIEKKDHDFVIGATIQASFEAASPSEIDANSNEMPTPFQEQPGRYSEATVVGNTETHIFDIPVVVIECKTYLDKTMLEGASRAAEELKARNPNSLYLVVMEWIKLTSDVNLRKYKVDQIYVLRQQKNTDREFRYEEGYVKNSINPTVVQHLFKKVRDYLTMDWVGGIEHGINRGWLIDE
ncbi:MAG TPA: Bpu10I family restriction endonuclease [Cyanobacteria bacterium UBA11149]|nr:Bpu10I family restriction endonuclease [Cyanobacteria bacterium UBA11367]HBE59544.1 Bpu10I family restriction endonuclease [Cyanobacteria bacterium UBA11366]HBK63858.1 Bpu10I family restriction endonuclease [Cyanobacteria bacterium UBA11166]HBR75575.1 Bpu10I family restriction endonuclease [Cyanobacteria bacterium UBA11159]HBS68584.1 Bpu10I family restriction endonuclease [Cyanobacteria bacterium UBA11153]HBW87418.1 Bpu10I family restriction endonuclease [Cyanobacteria bacterium UBA11149]H